MFLPSFYLSAWAYPETLSGQTPYVWIFSKEENAVTCKAQKE